MLDVPRDGTILRRRVVAEIEHDLVFVTPAPTLRGIVALDDGVPCLMKMFRGMPVGRIVAAADMAAGPADAQVNPARPGLQAFLAPVCVGRDVLNLVDM